MHNLDPWPWPAPQPGIYFNMPFDEYLAIPALSNSAIKSLLVAGPNFWADSWMNPFRKPRGEVRHFLDGTAYHHRILYGKESFYNHYAPAFKCPDDGSVLIGNKAMEQALKDIGVKGYSNKTASELAAMVAKHLPQKKIAVHMEAAHRAVHDGKEFLAAELIEEIELATRAIECNPYYWPWLLGGYPEVSVVWHDAEYNCLCKCRFDYLKISSITDLKTIRNENGRRFDKAVDYAIAGNKYIIQPAWYLRGARAAQQLIAARQIHGEADTAWLNSFCATPVEVFNFIFQQKTMALVTAGRIYSLRNKPLADQGMARVQEGIRIFHDYYHLYGSDIWISGEYPQHIDVDALPSFMSDL